MRFPVCRLLYDYLVTPNTDGREKPETILLPWKTAVQLNILQCENLLINLILFETLSVLITIMITVVVTL